MLVQRSNPDCTAQFADDCGECPSCCSAAGESVSVPLDESPRNNRKQRFLLLFTLPLLLFAGSELCTVLFSPFSGRLFDQDVWHSQSGSDSADNPRASMVHDLEWRYLHAGMSRAQVVKLLGEPDWHKQPDRYSYNVGMWSGFRIDYDSLDVHFVGDSLTHVRRVQH